MPNSKFSVLFVCLGNICRSPTAEGVFRAKAQQAGLLPKLAIDSAGTSAYHVGEAPDLRSQQTALNYGYDLSAIRSRQLTDDDFEQFDLLIAMDKLNMRNINLLNSNKYEHKVKLFLDDFATNSELIEVPDPYYGGEQGFDNVVRMIESASDGLIDYIQKQRLI